MRDRCRGNDVSRRHAKSHQDVYLLEAARRHGSDREEIDRPQSLGVPVDKRVPVIGCAIGARLDPRIGGLRCRRIRPRGPVVHNRRAATQAEGDSRVGPGDRRNHGLRTDPNTRRDENVGHQED